MEQVHERVAGLDVHRDVVASCARVPGPKRGVVVHKSRFTTTRPGLSELVAWLSEHAVTVVGMEATGVYWKPVVRHEALLNRVGVRGPHLGTVAAVR